MQVPLHHHVSFYNRLSSCTSLKSLLLHEILTTSNGFALFLQSLSHLKHLQSLHLRCTGLTPAHIVQLSTVILSSALQQTFRSLNLYSNMKLASNGAQELAQLLSHLSRLEDLDLAFDGLDPARQHLDPVSSLSSLTRPDISDNYIGSSAFNLLCDCLPSLRHLRSLTGFERLECRRSHRVGFVPRTF